MAKRDWAAIQRRYITDQTTSFTSLAAEHSVSRQAIAWHAARESWSAERCRFLAEVGERLVRDGALSAAEQLRRRNEKQLKANEQLRWLINHRLMYRRPDGSVAINGDTTILEVCRAVTAHCELYRLDRLVLGASTENVQPAPIHDRLAEMSEEELQTELKRIRAADFADLSDEELAQLGLRRTHPTLQ
jgi:hypothetical protein